MASAKTIASFELKSVVLGRERQKHSGQKGYGLAARISEEKQRANRIYSLQASVSMPSQPKIGIKMSSLRFGRTHAAPAKARVVEKYLAIYENHLEEAA